MEGDQRLDLAHGQEAGQAGLAATTAPRVEIHSDRDVEYLEREVIARSSLTGSRAGTIDGLRPDQRPTRALRRFALPTR